MLEEHDPEEVLTAPLAPKSLDRPAKCLGIRVLWCVELFLTGGTVSAILAMVFDNPLRHHLCLGCFSSQRSFTGPSPESTVFTVMA